MKKHEMHPYYFRVKPGSQGVFVVELLDRELVAMGIASKDREPLRFESASDAERHAKAKGLERAPF